MRLLTVQRTLLLILRLDFNLNKVATDWFKGFRSRWVYRCSLTLLATLLTPDWTWASIVHHLLWPSFTVNICITLSLISLTLTSSLSTTIHWAQPNITTLWSISSFWQYEGGLQQWPNCWVTKREMANRRGHGMATNHFLRSGLWPAGDSDEVQTHEYAATPPH